MIELRDPLSEEEQLMLLEDRNNIESKEKLILHNLKLVMWVAKQYYRPGENELDDLFQAGVIGLMRAIEGYDVDKGMLSSYAVWWVKQSITRDITNTGKTIRIPAYMVQEVNNLRIVKGELFKELEREPTAKELSIELGISINKVNEILNIIQDPISLNMAISDEDGELTIESSVIDENSLFEDALIGDLFMEQVIQEFKPKLTEEELNIIILSYCIDGKEYTLKEIGEHYNLSVEQVRQKKSKALRDMRRSHFMQQLKKDLDVETSFYRSIDYSQPRSSGWSPSSPVERIVLERERIARMLRESRRYGNE